MTRTARYLSWIVWQYLFVIFGFGVLVVAFQALITPFAEYEYAAGRVTGMAVAGALLFPTLLQLSMLPVYLPMCLSMGATRRGFFLGAQVAKVQLALGVTAIFELVQLAAEGIFHMPALFYGGSLASIGMVILLSTVLGETFGFVGMRFGRKGLVAMMILVGILSGLLGGAFGFLMAEGELSSALSGVLAVMMAVLTDARKLCAILFGISAALTGFNALQCRRFAIQ